MTFDVMQLYCTNITIINRYQRPIDECQNTTLPRGFRLVSTAVFEILFFTLSAIFDFLAIRELLRIIVLVNIEIFHSHLGYGRYIIIQSDQTVVSFLVYYRHTSQICKAGHVNDFF